MAVQKVLKHSIDEKFDWEQEGIRFCINSIARIKRQLQEETVLEVKGCQDDPLKIQELLNQHEDEQETLASALAIIVDYTGIKN